MLFAIVFFNIVLMLLSIILSFIATSFKYTPLLFTFGTIIFLNYQGFLFKFTPFTIVNIIIWWGIFAFILFILLSNFTWAVGMYINTSFIFSFLYFEIITVIADRINKNHNFINYEFNTSKISYFLISAAFAIGCAYKAYTDGEFIPEAQGMRPGEFVFNKLINLIIYFFGGSIFTLLYVDKFKLYPELVDNIYALNFKADILISKPMFFVYLYMIVSTIIGFIVEKSILMDDVIIKSRYTKNNEYN